MSKAERLPNPAQMQQYAPHPTTTRGAPTIINFHPKESKVIYCSGKLVVIRNLSDPTDCFVYKGHNDPTTVAAFSPNGFWVASGDCTGKVRIWSYDNPEHTLKLEVPIFSGEIKDIAWGPESKRIIAVGDGKGMMARVFMWDTGNSVGEIVGHQKRILGVDYKPNRPFRIMTASEDFNVCCYAGPPFKFSQSLTGNHTNFVNSIRYSPDGTKAVSVGSDKLMCIYDGKTGDLLEKFPVVHKASIYSVCWSPDGTQLLTASADKTVKLWDVASKSVVQEFTFAEKPQLTDMQVAVRWKEDLLVSLNLSGDINYLDLANASKPKQILQGHQVSILAIDAMSDGTIFTGSYDGKICAWKNGVAQTVTGKSHTAKITSICAVKEAAETAFVSVGWDDTIRFAKLNPATFFAEVKLNGQPNGVAVCPTQPSRIVVSTLKGITLVENTQIVFESNEFSWTPSCIAISPDGSQVAVGGQEDMKIHIFDVDGNNRLVEAGELVGHRGALTCVEYSPDGNNLAAGDTAREIMLWDVPSRQPKVQGQWVYHTTRVTSISWSPSSNYLASGSLDENIYIWNANNPSEKVKYDFTHKDGVTGVKFINETTLVSVGNDACVNTWKV